MTDHAKLRTPSASEAIVADLMMPHQANGLRRPSVFGGVIMSMVDRCSALSAMRHASGQVTTLSIDRILCNERRASGGIPTNAGSRSFILMRKEIPPLSRRSCSRPTTIV